MEPKPEAVARRHRSRPRPQVPGRCTTGRASSHSCRTCECVERRRPLFAMTRDDGVSQTCWSDRSCAAFWTQSELTKLLPPPRWARRARVLLTGCDTLELLLRRGHPEAHDTHLFDRFAWPTRPSTPAFETVPFFTPFFCLIARYSLGRLDRPSYSASFNPLETLGREPSKHT